MSPFFDISTTSPTLCDHSSIAGLCPSTTLSTDGNPKAQVRRLWYVDAIHLSQKLDSISYSPQLVNKDTNATIALSHSRIRNSIFRKPRDMGLEISEVVSHAVDIVLLTFILVWRERQTAKLKSVDMTYSYTNILQRVPSLEDPK
jgi:hypothetical protein